MSPDMDYDMCKSDINVAIHHYLGWKRHADGLGWYRGIHPMFRGGSPLPDYCTDLNAMYDAEESLTDDQYIIYADFLENERTAFYTKSLVHVAPKKRAECFVKTIGKWTGEPDV